MRIYAYMHMVVCTACIADVIDQVATAASWQVAGG